MTENRLIRNCLQSFVKIFYAGTAFPSLVAATVVDDVFASSDWLAGLAVGAEPCAGDLRF